LIKKYVQSGLNSMKKINLGCQLWGNLLATDPNLVKLWCRHYCSVDYIDTIFLKINYNHDRPKDLKLFEDILLEELKEKNTIIYKSDTPYSCSGGESSMKKFHCDNMLQTDVYIPRDIDEFIDFNILTKKLVEEFISDNNIPAMMGYTRDRVMVNGENKLMLSDIDISLNLNDQFNITQQDLNIRLRRSLNKVIMIKNTHILTGGGAHKYYDPVAKIKNFPKPHIRRIPIDHYCWLKSSVYNRRFRPNSGAKGYRAINEAIDKYFTVDPKDMYSRNL
jgi:hypothetical protein